MGYFVAGTMPMMVPVRIVLWRFSCHWTLWPIVKRPWCSCLLFLSSLSAAPSSWRRIGRTDRIWESSPCKEEIRSSRFFRICFTFVILYYCRGIQMPAVSLSSRALRHRGCVVFEMIGVARQLGLVSRHFYQRHLNGIFLSPRPATANLERFSTQGRVEG